MIILFRNNVIDGGKNNKMKIWDIFSTSVWANQEDFFQSLVNWYIWYHICQFLAEQKDLSDRK